MPFWLNARSNLNGTVTACAIGKAIATVSVNVEGSRLVAPIAVEAVDALAIQDGNRVAVIINASQVMLGVE